MRCFATGRGPLLIHFFSVRVPETISRVPQKGPCWVATALPVFSRVRVNSTSRIRQKKKPIACITSSHSPLCFPNKQFFSRARAFGGKVLSISSRHPIPSSTPFSLPLLFTHSFLISLHITRHAKAELQQAFSYHALLVKDNNNKFMNNKTGINKKHHSIAVAKHRRSRYSHPYKF